MEPRAPFAVKCGASRDGGVFLRHLKFYWTLGFAYLGLIVYFTLTSRPPTSEIPFADKWQHCLAYGLLMGWFGQFLGPALRPRWALAFVLLGGLLELLQGLGGVRHAEWADFGANAVGVCLGYALTRGRGGRGLVWLEGKLT